MSIGEIAIITGLLLVVASCGLPPESQKRVADCSAMYVACVEDSDSMTEYGACRALVDARCLDDDAGAP